MHLCKKKHRRPQSPDLFAHHIQCQKCALAFARQGCAPMSTRQESQRFKQTATFFVLCLFNVLYRDPIAMYRNLIGRMNGLYTFYSSPQEALQCAFRVCILPNGLPMNSMWFCQDPLKGLSLGFRDQGLGLGVGFRVQGLEFIQLSQNGEIVPQSTNRYIFCFMSIQCALQRSYCNVQNLIWHINGPYTFSSSPQESLLYDFRLCILPNRVPMDSMRFWDRP